VRGKRKVGRVATTQFIKSSINLFTFMIYKLVSDYWDLSHTINFVKVYLKYRNLIRLGNGTKRIKVAFV